MVTVVVERAETLAEGVRALVLRAPGGRELPAWRPGAHVDLLLEPGLVRQYSLCGDPADRSRWTVAVLREPGGRGGSRFVHDRIAVGATLTVEGPRNHFELVASPAYLFIAGGIGITPILPMVAAAEAAGADWRLLYGGRRRAAMAGLDRLARYGDRVQIFPQDTTGLIDLSPLDRPTADTLVYCCGPEPLLTAVERRCVAWPPGALRVERFTTPAVTGADHEFEVTLASSGRTVRVPAGVSVLEAVEDAGVPVLSSCQEGTCGTCETVVLDGVPDHRDAVLTAAERAAGELMMICVSRCRGTHLTLDL
ncbi:PDR/VanB family oxidoreductase [Actinoplanes sp. NEAU-A12]|uniref:PDR/VanB family oxidoreductase n=1 Tax=Actinoplanes sandaracinus TaxID=3045177 RepID=A0ABT6WPI7_9ACTN|nr:PDR/VanB family oxidoreductase [Actinoplanes sandaracinus]MDI6101658.1 PDR/VanB family oxidoreductase [Actinoplanes sandaracinus]